VAVLGSHHRPVFLEGICGEAECDLSERALSGVNGFFFFLFNLFRDSFWASRLHLRRATSLGQDKIGIHRTDRTLGRFFFFLISRDSDLTRDIGHLLVCMDL
jgi:hypothetical protein